MQNTIDTILTQQEVDTNLVPTEIIPGLTVKEFNFWESNTPAIYVACLAAYNNGFLHGRWIDATQGIEAVNQEIQEMLKESPANEPGYPCEEWAIHDFNFNGIRLDEYESIEDVCKIAEKLDEHGDAFVVAYQYTCDLEEAIECVEDRYIGEYESGSDFIENFVEDTCMLEGVSDFVKRYIDYDAILRDMEYGGEIFSDRVSDRGNVHYFWNR